MSRKQRKQNCNKYKKQKNKGDNYLRVIQGGALERTRKKEVNIVPRNFHQDDLLGLNRGHKHQHSVCHRTSRYGQDIHINVGRNQIT